MDSAISDDIKAINVTNSPVRSGGFSCSALKTFAFRNENKWPNLSIRTVVPPVRPDRNEQSPLLSQQQKVSRTFLNLFIFINYLLVASNNDLGVDLANGGMTNVLLRRVVELMSKVRASCPVFGNLACVCAVLGALGGARGKRAR
jgi:hypothetical protein